MKRDVARNPPPRAFSIEGAREIVSAKTTSARRHAGARRGGRAREVKTIIRRKKEKTKTAGWGGVPTPRWIIFFLFLFPLPAGRVGLTGAPPSSAAMVAILAIMAALPLPPYCAPRAAFIREGACRSAIAPLVVWSERTNTRLKIFAKTITWPVATKSFFLRKFVFFSHGRHLAPLWTRYFLATASQ